MRLWIPFLIALCLAVGVACGDDDDASEPVTTPEADATQDETASDAGDAFPLTITRSDGAELTLDQPAERIVSLDPSATEVLYAIGAGDQVVAADLFSNYPEDVEAKARLDGFQPSPEAILAEEPDLVLMFANDTGAVDVLDDLGASVLFLEVPDSLEGIYERIELYGQVTGHEEEAADLVDSMTERVDAVVETVADVEQGPSFFHELDPTLFTISPSSFVGDLYVLLKAQNIADDSAGEFPQLTSEAVIAADPEVIILADEGGGESLETVQSRPGWSVINAVVEGRVHQVDPDVANRPGPRVVELLEILLAYLYPEFAE
ncbi:MAG TPA: ABC transporter substrate-binding protein [Dehalococcoidia bacterium]|nr:ABC transporter substrate-binding protein [Dehalococcoidia bacterium]